jgi:MYXO-CTERM domain-containing protein
MEAGDMADVSPAGDGPAATTNDADEESMAPDRDPDAIAREIEQTRAELADTIDAIADRISPKKAAARSAQAVKSQVASAREAVTGNHSGNGASDEPGSAVTPTAAPVVPIAALAGLIVVILLFIRRRRSR